MSHWYPHTIGTKEDQWYWIIHPTFEWVHTAGEPDDEDCDWNTVSWWNGPFRSWDAAQQDMSDKMGNAGSYTGPSEDPECNKLQPKLQEQMNGKTRARSYW